MLQLHGTITELRARIAQLDGRIAIAPLHRAEIDLGRAALLVAQEEYPQMSVDLYLARLDQIAEEAAGRWPGSRVAIAHRTGHLGIGELAVVVADDVTAGPVVTLDAAGAGDAAGGLVG